MREVYAYWRDLAAPPDLPRRTDIDPLALVRMLPHLQLIDLGETPDDLYYRLAGAVIVGVFGFEPRGLTRREIRERYVAPDRHAEFNVTSRETFDVATKKCVSYTHDHMTAYERGYISYARLLLPISEDGQEPSGIFGAIFHSGDKDAFWEDFRELHTEMPL